MFLWVEEAGTSVEPKNFSLAFFLLSFTFQEIISALSLNMLSRYIYSLSKKNLAFKLFVYNNANSMLGNIVKSSNFAMITFVGVLF